MFAKLQFVEYFVKHIEYKSDPFHDALEKEQEAVTLTPKFDYNISFKDEELSESMIELIANIGDKNLKETPFFVSATVSGIFRLVDSEITKDEKFNYYKVNALAILFPYLRSVISDITSKGSEVPLILPTINIVSLFRKIEEEKVGKDELGN